MPPDERSRLTLNARRNCQTLRTMLRNGPWRDGDAERLADGGAGLMSSVPWHNATIISTKSTNHQNRSIFSTMSPPSECRQSSQDHDLLGNQGHKDIGRSLAIGRNRCPLAKRKFASGTPTSPTGLTTNLGNVCDLGELG